MAFKMNHPIIKRSFLQKNSPFITSTPNPLKQDKDVDFDNLTDQQKKEMNLLPEVEIARYGVNVTRYKNSLETGNSNQQHSLGHLQASISNPKSEKVRADLGIGSNYISGTRINPWTVGNMHISSKTKLREGENYKNTPEFETQRIYLTKDEAKNFIKVASTIKKTKDPFTFKILGSEYTLPVGSEGYDLIKNNCADGVCKGLGMDSTNAKVRLRSGGIVLDALVNQVMTDGGISEPKKAWRLIMDKYGIKKKL